MNTAKKYVLLIASFATSFAITSAVQANENSNFICKTCNELPKVSDIIVNPAPVTVMQGAPVWENKWDETREAAPAPEPAPKAAEVPLKPMQPPKPHEVVATENLDAPHKILAGEDLETWNRFCRGQEPSKVYEWRYNKCNGLDADFKK